MSELEIVALEILSRYEGTVLGCGTIGDELFPGGHGSAPYARIAGKVMKRLKRRGLATWGRAACGDSYGWRKT